MDTVEKQVRDECKDEWANSAYIRQSYNFDFECLVARRLQQRQAALAETD